jgi:signal peptidase I
LKSIKTITKNKLKKFSKSFFESLQVIITSLAVIVIITTTIGAPTTVIGSSMTPYLQTGDLLIAEKVSMTLGDLKRGDIVAFHATEDKDYIKRIIGIAGDRIRINQGQLYVNGISLNEPYITKDNKNILPGTFLEEDKEVTVPENTYFMLGDNRKDSLDSRYIGFVNRNKIIGKAWYVLWPFGDNKLVQHVSYPELITK